MKNRKNNPIFLAVAGVLAVAIVGVGAVTVHKKVNENKSDYIGAYERTNALKKYEMKFSVIVNVDGEMSKQTAIDQVLKADMTKDKLIYSVETDATLTQTADGKVDGDKSRYTYYDGKYYYDLQNIRYTSDVGEEAARQNLVNFTNMIAFPYEKMIVTEKEENENETVYYYNVDYENISDYVKAVCQSAVDAAGEGNYRRQAEMSATVKDGYVVKRCMYIECESAEGGYLTVEFVSELIQKDSDIEIPDISLYEEL